MDSVPCRLLMSLVQSSPRGCPCVLSRLDSLSTSLDDSGIIKSLGENLDSWFSATADGDKGERSISNPEYVSLLDDCVCPIDVEGTFGGNSSATV